MDLVTREQLPLVVLLILPGFISIKVFDLLVPGEQRTLADQVLESLAYGLLNLGLWYVVMTDVLLPARSTSPWLFRFGVFGVLVASPIALGILANAILRARWMRPWVRHPVRTAWDFHFAKRQPGWLLIRLKSGALIGGLFGAESFASSFPHRDIYLEETWILDDTGGFEQPVAQSNGLLVSMDDCETIEFFAWDDQGAGDDDDTERIDTDPTAER